MPYIDPKKREQFTPIPQAWAGNSGELNFSITELIREYWAFHGESYQAINDIIGALEGAKLEFYRRIAVPYEDEKIRQNGDVY